MDIIRTQIYLRKSQHRELKEQAHRLGVSFTELLRRALDQFLGQAQAHRQGKPKGLAAITGLGSSGVTDGSVRHDDYVFEAIQAHLKRSRTPQPPPPAA